MRHPPALQLLAVAASSVLAGARTWTAAALAAEPVATPAPASKKTAAVDKVIAMLADLQVQVQKEGEEDAATYNKFACFCKDTTTEKTAAISAGEDAKSSLAASIGELATRRDELDKQIAETADGITKTEGELKEAEAKRQEELKTYQANEVDLTGALQALEGAIASLKTAKTTVTAPSLLAIADVKESVRMAVVMADALGIGGASTQRAAALLLQKAPEVPTENYDFKSDSVISTLESLLTDFKAEKDKVDADEVSAVAAYDALVQEKTNHIKTQNEKIETDKKEKEGKQEAIATANQELTTTSATLLDDQQYLSELSDLCSGKAKTWDQRSQARADELSALSSALAIIKSTVQEKTSSATIRFAQQGVSVRLAEIMVRSPPTMEALEAEAEAADEGRVPAAFLQVRRSLRAGRQAHPADGRQVVIDLLRRSGKQLRSTMLTSLAGQLAADPLAKVKTLIQELIERLQQESANEATQKGWCDKSLSAAEQKRDSAAENVEQLNGGMAELEAQRDLLKQELTVLANETADLQAKQTEADALRATEKAQNEATVTEAKEGQTAVEQAIDILDKFYKTAAKATVPASLAQSSPSTEVPDAGFDNGEAYTGSSSAAGGVIGMLEVIKSDFERTVTETEAAEKEAEEKHLAFTTETQKSLAEKEVATTEKTKQKDDAEDKLTADSDSLNSEITLLQGAIEELLQLKAACIDTGMSYADRVARREEEVAALKKAECILSAYAQFGPDGAASADC